MRPTLKSRAYTLTLLIILVNRLEKYIFLILNQQNGFLNVGLEVTYD